jgi:Na+-transporting methylmalonyl-CoA/oxaloacetate decarboxylase gamma subunit
MDWAAELYVAGAGLISVFGVLMLLFLSMVGMSLAVRKTESSKTAPPAQTETKK